VALTVVYVKYGQAAEWSDLLVLDLRDIVATLSEEEELVLLNPN